MIMIVLCHPFPVDSVLQAENRVDMTLEDQLHELLEKLDATCGIKHSAARSKRSKQLKREINIIRRRLAIQKGKDKPHNGGDASSRNIELSTEESSSSMYPFSSFNPITPPVI